MNQSKFSLADLLALLAAPAFGFVCFLGANFLFLEEESSPTIPLSVIITVLLAGTALGAKLLKRTSRHFKTCFVWEIILLVLFAGVAVFAYSPFAHYFNVSAKKTEIQNQLSTSITQAENMFAEYERYAQSREDLYRRKLQSVVALKDINPSKYVEYGFEDNSVDDYKQIENKMFTVHADLFPSEYEEMKQVNSNWLADARNIVNSWKPIGIVGVVNEIATNSNQWLNELIQLSTMREKGEQTYDFAYNLTFEDVKSHFTTHGKPSPLSIVLALVAYALLLLSWWITVRSTKSPFGRGKRTGGNGPFDINLKKL